jgi:hypothetical protein
MHSFSHLLGECAVRSCALGAYANYFVYLALCTFSFHVLGKYAVYFRVLSENNAQSQFHSVSTRLAKFYCVPHLCRVSFCVLSSHIQFIQYVWQICVFIRPICKVSFHLLDTYVQFIFVSLENRLSFIPYTQRICTVSFLVLSS